jgi:hypothetical protein
VLLLEAINQESVGPALDPAGIGNRHVLVALRGQFQGHSLHDNPAVSFFCLQEDVIRFRSCAINGHIRMETLKMSHSPAEDSIHNGTRVADALRAFSESVNRPGTIFSTERWLLPRLERLTELLHDPITDDEAAALLDVLHEQRRMKDLLDWLEGESISWPSFFVRRKFLEEEAERKRREDLRRADDEWAQRNTEWGIIESLLTAEERAERETDRAEARQQYLSDAKSCPRCGTPPEYLEWFYYSSPPSSWANLCGRAGWKTRCKSCLQQIDFFVGMMN